MPDYSTTPASVSNVKALDTKRLLANVTGATISGRTITLTNAQGGTVASVTVPDTVIPTASATQAGIVQLTSTTDSTSETIALTALGGKTIMDTAKGAAKSLEISGQTVTLKDATGATLSTIAIPSYTLPTATASRLGGVKIGAGINVSGDGTISVDLGDTMTIVGTVASVDALPQSGNDKGDVYMVGSKPPYEEYYWTGSAWEFIGLKQDEVDLSGYLKTTDFLNDTDFIAFVEGSDA